MALPLGLHLFLKKFYQITIICIKIQKNGIAPRDYMQFFIVMGKGDAGGRGDEATLTIA